ncbi:hypothetical protein H0I23_11480 [Cellulophaga sp. HaHaR_3_176]|uniref:hypothetical protein n=1 Tax=Cellulophaga sp. HaHaR_3_176 TaxID=1942464 RepID=UPI001C1FDF21|nr:hypothetical protein [Cellulophaga sp. HaHaR_3_176]QWX83072.1 hypothetical protein H0I23_11480 [Cellulophaga sp. HaHaR_3_176]
MIKITKLFTLTTIVLFCVKSSFAQQAYSPVPEEGIVNFVTSTTEITDSKTNGTPYLNESFVDGEIIVNDKVELVGKMRFNAHGNEVEILNNDAIDSYYSLLKRSYISVRIGNKKYRIFTYKDSRDAVRTSYFSDLNEGGLKLLFKPESVLKQARRPSTSYEKYVPPTYVWNSSYYILDQSNKDQENHAIKIKLSKNNILDFTGDKKEEMKIYVKENKLNLKKEEDVISFLNYYNSVSK